MPRPAQSEAQRDVVRRRILDAAQDLFDKKGIEAVSMRALGAQVGLTASALYPYFPAKLDLLRALWWDTLDELHLRLEGISQAESDPIRALQALGMAYIQFCQENPARFRVLFSLERGGLIKNSKEQTERHPAYIIFHHRVVEAIALGRLRFHDADLVAQVLWAGAHGLAMLTNSAPMFDFEDSAKLAPTMLEALLHGVSAS